MGAIVSDAEVTAFMSSPIVKATFDDDNDGVVDASSLAIIVDTSEGLFFANIRALYELPLSVPIDPFAKHVVLQIIHCQCIKRHPELFRATAASICEEVAELLKQLRKGELRLNHPLLAPANAATGPAVDSIASRDLELLEPYYGDGTD